MQVSLVITVLGPDRRGLVRSLSETLSLFHGSWTESNMSRLAGKFAGILKVSVSLDQQEALTKALLASQTDKFRIQIEKADQSTTQPSVRTLTLEILAHDREGIVHDITKQLALLNINIDELESKVREASMAGGTLFCANLTLGLPEGLSARTVQQSLEDLSDDFMVDITS